MRTTFMKQIAAVVISAGVALPALAVPVSTVGTLDSLLGSAELGSSSLAAENSFIQGLIGTGYTLTGKYEDFTSTTWQSVDSVIGGWAFDFGATTCSEGSCSTLPDYYVIKLGVGKSPDGTDDTYLFRNLDSLQWAYINLSQFDGVTDMNIGRVSHITVGPDNRVPEPGSLALLGLGLLGLGAVRRVARGNA